MKIKKLKRKVKILNSLRILSLLCLMLTIVGFVAMSILSATFNNITSSKFSNLDKPISILMMGIDTGGEGRAQSDGYLPLNDTMMIVSFNPQNTRANTELNITSVPRDVLTEIACTGNTAKINSAMAAKWDSSLSQGDNINNGSKCAKESVEQLLGIKIDYYMTADFAGLISVIDGIKGIELNVSYAFCEQDSNGNEDAICFKEGKQTMNGEQALAYARQRKAVNPKKGASGDDYERNIRQQEVLMATAKKIVSNPTGNVTTVVDMLTKHTWSNITGDVGVMTKLVSYAGSLYNGLQESIAAGNNVNIYVKQPEFGTQVFISPIEDIAGVKLEDVSKTDSAEFFKEDSSFANATTVYNVVVSKYSTTIPSKIYQSEIKPMNFEFEMETIQTEEAPGSYDLLITDEARSYFSTAIATTLDQEPGYPYK